MSDYEMRIHKFPVLDTGIGIEAGYESDAGLRAAVEAERAALPADVREAVEEIEREALRKLLLGG